MKKPIVTLIFCLFTLAAMAQTTQGTISLGGSVGIQADKDQAFDSDFGDYEEKSSTVLFAPTAGYFIADGMELGLGLGFSVSKSEAVFEDDTFEGPTITQTLLGPYFKYYLFTANENFAFTFNASAQFGFAKSSPEEGEASKASAFEFAISPGFTYFFTEKIGLDFQLQGISYQSNDPNTDSDSDNDKSTSFTFGVSSLSPSLGFRYFFGK